MDKKYVLFIPYGGINDCFSRIYDIISYCKINKRTLLLHMKKSHYKINFSDYFSIKNIDCDIIYDSNKIKNFLLSFKDTKNFTIHPSGIDIKMLLDLFDETNNEELLYKKEFRFIGYFYNDILLNLPEKSHESIILHSICGGGNGFLFLKNLELNKDFKNKIKQKLQLLDNNYLCIQVRNTDLECDYINLYENNKEYINSFKTKYICTDSKLVYKFFKSKINVICFTTFPDKHIPIHKAKNIDCKQRFLDLFTDIFIATNSMSILSNSKGGFINLLRNCHKNKEFMLNLLNYTDRKEK